MMNNFEKSQAAKIASFYGVSTQEQIEINKGEFYLNNSIEKAKSAGFIGEIRKFGGREYIKTATGWKYHGKGGGAKAQSHAAENKPNSTASESKEKPVEKVAETKEEAVKSSATVEKPKKKEKYSSADYREIASRTYEKHLKEQKEIYNKHEVNANKQNAEKGRYETRVNHSKTYTDEARSKYGNIESDWKDGSLSENTVGRHLARKQLQEQGHRSPAAIAAEHIKLDVNAIKIPDLHQLSVLELHGGMGMSMSERNKMTAAKHHLGDEKIAFIEQYPHWNKVNSALNKEIGSIKKHAAAIGYTDSRIDIHLNPSDDMDFDKHTINFDLIVQEPWNRNSDRQGSTKIKGVVKFDNEGSVKVKILKDGLYDALHSYEELNRRGDVSRHDKIDVELHKQISGSKIKLPEPSEKSIMNDHLKRSGYQSNDGGRTHFDVSSQDGKLVMHVSNVGKKDIPSDVLRKLYNHSHPQIPGYTVDYSKVVAHDGKLVNAEKYKKDYMKHTLENNEYSEYEINHGITYPITKNKK